MQSGIYKITSILFPDRIYIGSAKDLRLREKQHYRDLRHGKHINKRLQNHANKYGHYDLNFTVIERTEDLIPREQFYIDQLNPFFNICKIAGNTQGRPQSEETRRKRSEALKGRKKGHLMTEAHREAIIAEKRARFPPAERIKEYILITPYVAVDHKNRSLHDYQCFTCKAIIRTKQTTLLKRITHHCLPRIPKIKVVNPKIRRKRQWTKARSDNSTKHVGITFDKPSQKYRARLKLGTKLIAIGYYDHIQDAIDARIQYVQTHNIPNRLGSNHH